MTRLSAAPRTAHLPVPGLLVRGLLVVALAVAGAGAGTLLAAPAVAIDTGQVAAALSDDPLLVDQRAAIRIDDAAVRAAVEDLPVPTYVVVLSERAVARTEFGIDGILLEVVEELQDPRAVVVVVTDGGQLQAGEGGASGVEASVLLDRIVLERSDEPFTGTALTGALLAFADAVERTGDEGARRGITGVDRRTVGVAGLVGVAVLACGLLWARSQRQVRRAAPLSDAETGSGGW